jgi:protein transport protein HofB
MNIPQLTALCLRYHGVLLDASEEVVHVAVVDAPSHELLDALHFATTKRIEITCWTRQQMEGHASRTQQTLPVAVQEKHQPKAELLTRTLQSALEQRASDIHIEPADNAYRIRLRIDGVLHPLPDVSPDAGVALTARLKVLGNLDIAEHRLPQDGQFTVELAGNAVSFRIAKDKKFARRYEESWGRGDYPPAMERINLSTISENALKGRVLVRV